MFDVSFVELLIIGVVALVVLGPERLPAAARTLGGFVRRARRSWQSVRSEFERELAADELKRSIRDSARELDVGASLRDTVEQVRAAVQPPAPAATPVEPGVAAPNPPPMPTPHD
jgi:sec-independent protein translocase protein TatB